MDAKAATNPTTLHVLTVCPQLPAGAVAAFDSTEKANQWRQKATIHGTAVSVKVVKRWLNPDANSLVQTLVQGQNDTKDAVREKPATNVELVLQDYDPDEHHARHGKALEWSTVYFVVVEMPSEGSPLPLFAFDNADKAMTFWKSSPLKNSTNIALREVPFNPTPGTKIESDPFHSIKQN